MVLRQSARIALAALLATALSAPAALPAHAEKGGGKPENAGGGKADKAHKGGDKGGGDKGGGDRGGPDRGGPAKAGGGKAGGPDAGDLLAAGVTAAAVQALLGGQTQALSVGAKPLPPGIQKNLARGKALPPGLSREPVPPVLLGRLPVVAGHEWTRIGTELVLVEIASQVIAQVIVDVFL